LGVAEQALRAGLGGLAALGGLDDLPELGGAVVDGDGHGCGGRVGVWRQREGSDYRSGQGARRSRCARCARCAAQHLACRSKYGGCGLEPGGSLSWWETPMGGRARRRDDSAIQGWMTDGLVAFEVGLSGGVRKRRGVWSRNEWRGGGGLMEEEEGLSLFEGNVVLFRLSASSWRLQVQPQQGLARHSTVSSAHGNCSSDCGA
jgi:hypothetical protein